MTTETRLQEAMQELAVALAEAMREHGTDWRAPGDIMSVDDVVRFRGNPSGPRYIVVAVGDRGRSVKISPTSAWWPTKQLEVVGVVQMF